MIKPEDVTHKRYPVDAVVFNNGTFSVAWGTWDGKQKLLGMRWNTSDADNPNDVGYPKTFGHPVWFMIPEDLTIPTLKGLLTSETANKNAVKGILAGLGEEFS